MTYNIAICDDETAQVDYLTALVRGWAASRRFCVEITAYAGAEQFLLESEVVPDILLLDIQMGKMDGMDLAREIRRSGGSAQIIFITGYARYMADGYEVDALHYLMKPVSEEKLHALLDKAVARIGESGATMLLQTNEGAVRVKIEDIIYVEAFSHYMKILCARGGAGDVKRTPALLETRAKISELEAQLGEGFVRCHRSYLVGLRHVFRITKTDVVLEGGALLPLSRRMYADVNRAFIEFYKQEGV